MKVNSFAYRHIGTRMYDIDAMLKTIGVDTLEELIHQTVPDEIRSKEPLNLAEPMTENEYLTHVQQLARKNKVFKTYIGLGYHPKRNHKS